MGQTILTPRKREALVAVLLGGYPWHRVAGGSRENARTYASSVRSRAGGATRRMCEELRSLGFLDRDDKLTVKGYEALIEQLSGDSWLGKLVDPAELGRRHIKRCRIEAERKAAADEAARLADIERRARLELRDRQAEAAAAGLLREFKLTGWESWDRDKLLDFADRMASL
jgi:hypothetical protein